MIVLTRFQKTVFAAFSLACVVHLGYLRASNRFVLVQGDFRSKDRAFRDTWTSNAADGSDILESDPDILTSDIFTSGTGVKMSDVGMSDSEAIPNPDTHKPDDVYFKATGLTWDQLQEFSFANRMETYPKNGTGTFVDVTKDFDPEVFNSFCDGEDELLCVMPVFSAVDRFESRHSLRQSLGKLATKKKCKLFFIIGTTTDDALKATLKEEYTRERDILIASWLDTYRDLNNKAYAMVDWISKHCMNVPFVVHLIDDSYINLDLFLERLHFIEKTEKYYMLAPVSNTKTIRTHFHSSVTVQEYPYPRFPKYAYGWGYAFPSRVAERLLAHAFSATYCWIEDIWIGGHVRIAAGVKLFPIPRTEWLVTKNLKKYEKSVPDYSVLHGISDDLLNKFYTNAAEM